MSQFAQHYARLHDDDLIDLALRGDLIPEAGEALQAELTKRCIHDLASHWAIRQREEIALEAHRQGQIAHRAKVVGWRTKMLYAMASLMCAYGLFRLIYPNTERPGDDGGLMLVIGIAVFIFAVVSSWLSNLWSRRVLYRPPHHNLSLQRTASPLAEFQR